MESLDFHAHHSPPGAWFTFTCGALGAGGGFGMETGAVPQHRLYIGWAEPDQGPIHVLPFLQADASADARSDYTPEEVRASPRLRLRRLDPSGLQRSYGFATDRWTHGILSFALLTPVVPVPEPGAAPAATERDALLPAITGELVLDNTHGTCELTLLFAVELVGCQRGNVPIDRPDLIGWSYRGRWGAAFPRLPKARVTNSWTLPECLAPTAQFHRLTNTCCFAVPVPAGTRLVVPLVLGAYRDGIATLGIDLRYRHTALYAGIEDVLTVGLARHAELADRAVRQDVWLAASGLSAERRFLVAHSTRSYWYSNQVLMLGREPVWVVNEGEYAMANTFDLTVDHSFYESLLNPWALRSALDLFADRYSYVDEVIDPLTKQRHPGGISFCHDMGVSNAWSDPGHSTYELAHCQGCFSHMTAEQLANWILCATTYVRRTGDAAWLRRRDPVVHACLRSLLNRDHHDPARRTGLPQFDSARVGNDGREITTYDSLDHSLAQARNNLYMGTKWWATWLGIELLLARLGDGEAAAEARRGADRAARTIAAAAADPATGVIPAIFEPGVPGSDSAILPAIEGLVYPLWWDLDTELRSDGPFSALLMALQRHLEAVLRPGICLFPDGGWKLSSTSSNSWMSKIHICQHVADRVFGIRPDREVQRRGDEAHARWQAVGSRLHAASDQCVDGKGQGSKYYPRLVTSWLWLDGRMPPI